ncbi:fructosamine kinase family protein [Bacteroidota bacterium]
MGSAEYSFFEEAILQSTGTPVKVTKTEFLSGGCINNTLKLNTTIGAYFIKYSIDAGEDMFEKEFKGLSILHGAGDLRIPEPLGYGEIGGKRYLLLEYILSRSSRNDFWEVFGERLARMHERNTSEKYGLDHDNYIGRLPQSNIEHDDWIDFFISERLEPQIELALISGRLDKTYITRFRKLYNGLSSLLPTEQPTLLHGDLWSGNFMVGNEGEPVLIDPAVYYGHREIEMSFTKMFGGFDSDFYKVYDETYPFLPGFEDRVEIYNLYPYLVHVNLFGTSYLGGVDRVVKRYC